MEKRFFTYVVLGLFSWALIGTVLAGYYFVQQDMYQREYNEIAKQLTNISIKVDFVLNYGNGTRIWKNDTVLPLGSTAFNATIHIASDVGYQDFGGELGILVTSINGVSQNNTHGWFYWVWEKENTMWLSMPYSCAKYILHEGDLLAITYACYSPWPEGPM